MMTNSFRHVLPLVTLLLAACGMETPAPEITAQAPVAEKKVASVADSPIVATVETAEVFEEPELLPTLADPGELTGKTPRQVQEIMGEPDLVRKDGSVQVMLYEDDTCTLDVVFYESTLGDYFRASAVSARHPDGSNMDTGACFSALRDSATGR